MISLKQGDTPDSKFNKKQLRIGARVEKEHTNNPEIAKQIAKAHLVEIPDYYKKLKCVEGNTKRKSSRR